MTEAPLVVPGIEDSRRKRLGRWALAVAIALLVGIGLLLIFLLAQATNNRLLYERYYTLLRSYSFVNGRFDEDLFQVQVIEFLIAVSKFRM